MATVRVLRRTEELLALEIDGVRRVVHLTEAAGVFSTSSATGRARWAPLSARAGGGEAAVPALLSASLPGTVTSVPVRAGDPVAAGQVLVVMEAMKMEHSLVAPRDGVVRAVAVAVGDRVNDGAVLVRLVEDAG